jgi:hypothetical protein
MTWVTRQFRSEYGSLCLVLLLAATGARAGAVNGVDVPGSPDVTANPGPAAGHRTAEVVIDFDDVVAPCLFLETAPLRDHYLGLGVRFFGPDTSGGGAILNACGNFSVTGFSGTNFLAFNDIARYPGGGVPITPETIRFTSPVSAVSILVGSNESSGQTVTLDAYDAADVLVDSQSRVLGPALGPLAVTAPSITRVVLGGGHVLVVDDLRFTPGGIVAAAARSWGQVKAIYR